MPREKRADEIFCRFCGEPIKREAELCPHCGVKNEKGSASSSRDATASVLPATHDPSKYETTVSDSWWYGIAGGTTLWTLIFVYTDPLGNTLGAFGAFLTLVAWVGLPLSAYYDMQYVRANGKWNPDTAFWVTALAIWVVNIIMGAVYLYRRHKRLGEP